LFTSSWVFIGVGGSLSGEIRFYFVDHGLLDRPQERLKNGEKESLTNSAEMVVFGSAENRKQPFLADSDL
jgi:hypothetical protein